MLMTEKDSVDREKDGFTECLPNFFNFFYENMPEYPVFRRGFLTQFK